MGKDKVFDIFIPLILAIIGGVLIYFDKLILNGEFVKSILSVLGIIAGFSITAIAVLTSTDNNTVRELKSKLTGISFDGMEISVFRRFYILISYSTLASFIAILLNIIANLIPWHFFDIGIVASLKGLNLFILLHIFFINIRNICSLYFIYFNETNIDQIK